MNMKPCPFCGSSNVKQWNRRSTMAVSRDAVIEECAKVVESFGKPWALNTAAGAMMFRAEVDKIVAAIRALSSSEIPHYQEWRP